MQGKGWSELHAIWLHTMRLLLKKKQTLAVFALSLLFFFLLLFFLEEAKEEKSVVFLGVADEDQTALSRELAGKIRDCEAFSVTEAPLEELLFWLSQGKLAAVFFIKEGYEEAVNRGEERRLLTMYEADGMGLPLLADIVAGNMMHDICTSKGFLAYRKAMEGAGRGQEALSKEAYAAYVKEFSKKEAFDFSFAAEYVDKGGADTDAPEQAAIYMQVIFAVLAMLLWFLAVYAVTPYADLCHGSAAKRLRLLPLTRALLPLGSGGAALSAILPFGVAAVAMLSVKNGISISGSLWMFLYTAAYSGGIVIMTMLSARAFRHTAGYQLFMLVVVVVFGAAGCASIAGGLLPGMDLLGFVPNSVYVKAMTRCYLRG